LRYGNCRDKGISGRYFRWGVKSFAELGLTYIFLKAPAKAEIHALRTWIKEVAPTVEVEINYLYP